MFDIRDHGGSYGGGASSDFPFSYSMLKKIHEDNAGTNASVNVIKMPSSKKDGVLLNFYSSNTVIRGVSRSNELTIVAIFALGENPDLYAKYGYALLDKTKPYQTKVTIYDGLKTEILNYTIDFQSYIASKYPNPTDGLVRCGLISAYLLPNGNVLANLTYEYRKEGIIRETAIILNRMGTILLDYGTNLFRNSHILINPFGYLISYQDYYDNSGWQGVRTTNAWGIGKNNELIKFGLATWYGQLQTLGTYAAAQVMNFNGKGE